MAVNTRSLLQKTLIRLTSTQASAMQSIKVKSRMILNYLESYRQLTSNDSEDMLNLIREINILAGENFVATPMPYLLDDLRDYLNECIPDLLRMLPNTMPENLARIANINWRNLLGIGVVVDTASSDDSSASR